MSVAGEMMELIVGLGIFAVLIAAIYIFGRWILGPIDRAAKARDAPVRFSLGDFLCLFVAVQLPLTAVSHLQSDDAVYFYWIFMFLAWVVAPVIWVTCAAALSRARITSGKHRLLFMGLVLPIVYYGLTPFVLMGLAGLAMLLHGRGGDLLGVWWGVPTWMLTGAALVGCGLYTNWLAALGSAEPPPRG